MSRRITAVAAALSAAATLTGTARAKPQENYYLQQGVNDWRTSAVHHDASKTGYASFSYSSIGRHVNWQYAGVACATPVTTEYGLVLIADSLNNMRAYYFPEDSPKGALTLAWMFTQSAGGAGIISKYSGTVAGSPNGHVFWVNTQNSYLWGLNTTTPDGVPIPLSWAPLNLTAAASDNHFRTWTQESSILFHDNHVWVPATDEHVALSVAVGSGATAHTNLTLNGARFFGSVGTTEHSGHSAAFISSTYHLAGFDNSAKELWHSSLAYTPVANEFSHPIMIEIPNTETRCIIMSKAQDGGLFIMGAAPTTGKACLSWSSDGYLVRTIYTETPSWVSAPAVVLDGTGYLLYYAVNLQNVNSQKQSALVSIKVDKFGVITSAAEDGIIFTGVHINSAPVAFLNAYGSGGHAVVVVLSDGSVKVFDHKGFSDGNARESYDGSEILTMPQSEKGMEAAGNYIGVTPGGSVMYVAYDLETKDTYLVAVTRALAGRTPGPSPQPIPVGPAGDNAPTGPSGGTVAGAVFGVAGGLAAAAALVVYFAPNYGFKVGSRTVVPADLIKSAARGTANAAKSAGQAVSRAVSGGSGGLSSSSSGSGGKSMERTSLLRGPTSTAADAAKRLGGSSSSSSSGGGGASAEMTSFGSSSDTSNL